MMKEVKKVWSIKAGRVDMEGRYLGVETVKTVLATATKVLDYVEQLKKEAEEKYVQWWMVFAEGMEDRPMIYAEELKVEEI